MGSRSNLHTKLVSVLGSNYVYFQPPENIKLVYPCIIYSRDEINNTHADNSVYKQSYRYTITAIYKNPDSTLPITVSKLPGIKHNRHFVSDGLYHDVFELYYYKEV